MPTPFPGMDPYLEQPALWPDVHNRLIAAIADALAPQLRPRYYVAIEERTYAVAVDDLVFAGRADVAVVEGRPADSSQMPVAADPGVVVVEVPVLDEVRETFLEVRSVAHERIVTVLEILSPANKRAGAGRTQYIDKRFGIFGTRTNLVELDLLRAGEPMPVLGWSGRSDYRILVSRGERRPRADLLPFSVRQPIPSPSLPLQPGDTEPRIEIGSILHALYDRAGYDLRLNYRAEPDPPLASGDAAWANALLCAAGLR
jgi:hypothetical protein